MTHQPFLRFFALLLAIVAGLALALIAGVPQAVWRADQSMMTSAIGLLFVVAVARIGISSWSGGDWRTVKLGEMLTGLFPMMGLFGTVAGLFINREAFSSQGVQALGLMGTALVSTGTGILASGLTLILTHNLETSREI